jgi:predicted transporter
MKVLQGILITILSFIPWAYMFFYRLFVSPLITENGGQVTVAVLAVIVLILSLRAYVKGYGRQE